MSRGEGMKRKEREEIEETSLTCQRSAVNLGGKEKIGVTHKNFSTLLSLLHPRELYSAATGVPKL